MTDLIAAWGIYVGIVGTIYVVAQSLDEILRKDIGLAIGERFAHSYLAAVFQNSFALSIRGLDRVLGFVPRGAFLVPRVRNSFLATIAAICILYCFVLAIPEPSREDPLWTRLYLQPLKGLVKSDTMLGISLLATHLVVLGAVTDYLSFIKTRTVLHWTWHRGAVIKILMLLADLVISLALAVGISFVAIKLMDLWVPPLDDFLNKQYQSQFAHPVPTFSTYDALNNYSPLYFAIVLGIASFLTGVMIFFIGLTCQAILWTMSAIWWLDRVRHWIVPMLAFDKKPVQSSSAVIIIAFTAIYVPAAAIWMLN
ncbi:hypothetical protein [Bradyrhizobium sp. AUGA SZCCT0431]|uniref:hypothetical protein n=1 Tax=Bradyrhizobium sp. AUGA SZCCT0431 TaxID=2807674 RepID=UPI001BA8C1E8|nr:hypothetical protein [Bradyrhizobium sp. AUGA SZCCT0431]MBR1148542.1 hypothetical protein [Bradyrhizobium sp. AUGA SZCCT0431]